MIFPFRRLMPNKLLLRTLFLCILLLTIAACDETAQPSSPDSPTSVQPLLWVGEMQPGGGSSLTVNRGDQVPFSVQAYLLGVTDRAGQGQGIGCTLHWGVPGQNWGDVPMIYDGDAPGLNSATDNDRYAVVIAPPPGVYGYTARCQDAAGVEVWQTGGDGQLTVSAPASTQPPSAIVGPRTVFVHLFEWKWTDVAQECENFLGPQGFAAVQVSPPNEHILPSDAPDFAWWVRYQPVSYQLVSRSGDRAQFIDMVQRCKAMGVDIYVDAVINHMTGMEEGTGTAGTFYRHYLYPNLDGTNSHTYSFNNFHHCGRPNDDIANYGDVWEVQTCELVNLSDLDTGSDYVQERIAAYLNDLVGIGVAGFRLDAAKHMNRADIAGILARVDGDPYVFQEVIDRGGEPISARDYLANGDVTEFNYGSKLSDTFLNGKLAWLENFGETWGLLPSADAVVFVDNHDNQRGHGGGGALLTHRDGPLYRLADMFMLAWPYGYPRIMSSYAWDGVNDRTGPPADSRGNTNDIYNGTAGDGQPDCFGDRPGVDWVCEHRWPGIGGMVGFHNATARNFFVSDWWSNGEQQIAFGRGDAGFAVINREDFAIQKQRFQTSLAPGRYCDIVHGEIAADGLLCTGPVITVEADGSFVADVDSLDALALHDQARIP